MTIKMKHLLEVCMSIHSGKTATPDEKELLGNGEKGCSDLAQRHREQLLQKIQNALMKEK